jgi:hypothetical protein
MRDDQGTHWIVTFGSSHAELYWVRMRRAYCICVADVCCCKPLAVAHLWCEPLLLQAQPAAALPSICIVLQQKGPHGSIYFCLGLCLHRIAAEGPSADNKQQQQQQQCCLSLAGPTGICFYFGLHLQLVSALYCSRKARRDQSTTACVCFGPQQKPSARA